MNKKRLMSSVGLLASLLMTTSVLAQEVLPKPLKPFKGVIALEPKDAKPAFPAQPTAPKGAPNVLLVLLDDVGFSAAQTFGGAINTPTLEALAHEGLRFNQFHTTATVNPYFGSVHKL
jgi:Sulfatase